MNDSDYRAALIFVITAVVIVLAMYAVHLHEQWTERKKQHRLSPMEQYLVMRARKRSTMRKMRQVVRDNENGHRRL